jgi:S-adenosylmethionine-diacylglycerol 3-amino-3-carboxypropyl transferase
MKTAGSEIAEKARFDQIRYAQCWEDADILVDGLAIEPGDICLSIASAGDNSLSLLTRDPARVIAVDLSEAQLACLDLRCAAYATLEHREFLELYGVRTSENRGRLLDACWPKLRDPFSNAFWSAKRPEVIARGFGDLGKFERYFRLFRQNILPLVHSKSDVDRLLSPKTRAEREKYFDEEWSTWRWRLLLRLFFSRTTMGALGRDPRFFDYMDGDLVGHIMGRVRHAAVELDPSQNPYIHWIMTGTFGEVMPLALRPETYETIRSRLSRIEWRRSAIEDAAQELAREGVKANRFNLSDIFEYMSPENTEALLRKLAEIGAPGGRLAYWNMMVPRSRSDALRHRLDPHNEEAARLFAKDRAFFYRAFIIEEIL